MFKLWGLFIVVILILTVESVISEKESGNLEQKGKRSYLRLILKLAL